VERDPITSSWRLLGPAVSHHFSTVGSPVTGTSFTPSPLTALTGGHCSNLLDPAQFVKTSGAPATAAERAGWVSECTKGIAHDRHGWQQTNLGIGAEYDRRDSSSVARYYAGYVVDSFDKPSIYAGNSYQWTLLNKGRVRLDAGFITMAWFRSIAGSDAVVRRQLILAALPMVSIEDKKSGLGLNLSFIPKISYHGRQYTVNTLTAQLSLAL